MALPLAGSALAAGAGAVGAAGLAPAPAAAQVDVGNASGLRKLVPAQQLEGAANQQYAQMLAEAKAKNALAPDHHPQLRKLRAIARQLIPHTTPWNDRARGWQWEVNLIASNAARRTKGAVSQAFSHHQPRRRPRLMRPAPLDPGQTLAIRAECWRSIKIRALSQHMSTAISQINRHQPMLILLFFDRQHLPESKMQIAVTTLTRGQCFRLATELLAIQLLIRLIDENHPVRRQTKRTTAIFVHAATHAEAVRRQTFRCAIAPMPDPARGIFRTVFIPEQPVGAELQFGEIHAGRDGLRGAERFSPWR